MKRNIFLLSAIMMAVIFSSCKKEKSTVEPFVFYTVSVDGNTVTFENKSTGADAYKWDFGDGSSSTDESPTHTYPGKGKYVPTLYATSSAGTTGEASTVIRIAKSSSIKLDDNSLSDWDAITENVVTAGAGSGNFIKAKYDYDGNNIYFYFEQHAAKSDGDIYDIYIDADNNPATGYLSGDIPDGAYDILLEGTIFDDWLDVYYHSGDQGNFGGFAGQSVSEFYTIGTVKDSGGNLRFEGAIKRSKLKGLTGQSIKIGVQVAANDWSAMIGFSPDVSSSAFFLDMSE